MMKDDFIEKHPNFKDALDSGRIDLFQLSLGGKNQAEIKEGLNNRLKITELAQKVISSGNFQLSKERQVKFVSMLLSDLGLEGCSLVYKEIIGRGETMGLGECPHDLLGINNLCRVSGTLSMRPISYNTWMSTTDEYVFTLASKQLDAKNIGIMVKYSSGSRFVFTFI